MSTALSIFLGAIAVLIIIVIFMRTDAHSLNGYWSSHRTGAVYQITAMDNNNFTITTNNGFIKGSIYGVRGVSIIIANSVIYGQIVGTQIVWDQDTWSKQGAH